MSTLKNITVNIHVNDNYEDPLFGIPAEFEEFLRYCRRLKFAECPNYDYWVRRFRDLAVEMGYPSSSRFVWPPPEQVRSCAVLG